MKRLLTFTTLLVAKLVSAQTNTFPPNDNAGIGTVTPDTKLYIITANPTTVYNPNAYNGDQRHITLGTGNVTNAYTGIRFAGGGSHEGYFGTVQDASGLANFIFQTYNGSAYGERMRIDHNGNMGIGTAAPDAKLDVTIVNPTKSYNPNAYNGDQRHITLETGNVTNAYAGIRFTAGSSHEGYFGTVQDASGLANFIFQTYNGSAYGERMRIDHNGNVGIGTTTPNEKLSVNGNIRAQEIKVEAANWPDYVFYKDYKLPSLQETEQHIKEKGHLPNILSAAEVKTNGVDLGEMNARLLQKIEELTLYMIEQNKQMEQVKKENAKIQELENKLNQLLNRK